MVKLVAASSRREETPALILGITAADYAGFLAGECVQIIPAALGLPGAAFKLIVVGGTTEEAIVERIRGGGGLTIVSSEAEAAALVEEQLYGKTKN